LTHPNPRVTFGLENFDMKPLMKARTFLAVLIILILSAPMTVYSEKQDSDNDYAVPAVSDLPLFGISGSPQALNTSLKEDLNPFPVAEQIKWFDINRDLQINDFDLEQFENIVKSLHGEKLSGIELSVRFRIAQKNQKQSFPILYDLDRDGMFTPYDVDYFTQMVHQLDRGASQGNELIQNFKLQLQSHK